MIIAFVLSVLNSTTEVRVRPERSRFGLGLQTERTHLSSDGPNDYRQLGNCSGQRIKQVGYVADRTADRDWCPVIIHYPSLRIISHFDDDRLSARVYIRLPITRPLPQIEDLLPLNGNCIEYETIIQTSETTTKHRGGTRCGYFFTTTTIRTSNI